MAMAKMTFEDFEEKKIYQSPEYHGLYSSSGYAKLEEARPFSRFHWKREVRFANS